MKLTKKNRERLLSYFGYYIVYTKNKIGGIVCTEINENKQSANKKVKQKKIKCYSSWVFHDVSFVFVKGKKYAVAGANGSGKTTLINIIAGLLQGFNGTVLSAELSVYSADEGWPERTDVRMLSTGSLMYENFDLDYWMKYIPDDNMVYVRMNYVIERSDLPYLSLWEEIISMIDDAPEPPKVVFDLRGNGGGMYPIRGLDQFVDSLNNADKEGVYVIIDNGIFSSAVALAADLRQKIENAVLVGLPAGEPVNTFGPSSGSTGIGFGGSFHVLPNNGCNFVVSDRFYVSWPGYEGEALMPDIEVQPTIEDYKQGIDTILEAVTDM